MAQAQRERRSEEVNYAQLTALVRQLPRPMSATHPTNAPTATAQTNNLVNMDRLMDILRGSRPPANDPRRAVYDQAVAGLGEGNKAEAVRFLERAMSASITRLTTLVRDNPDVGGNRSRLLTMLESMDQGIGEGDERYAAFVPIGNNVAELLRVLRGGTATAAPRQEDRPVATANLPLIEMPLHDLGPIHLLNSTSDNTVVTVNAQPTTTLNSLFGGQANAQTALNSLANAYAVMANSPNSLSAQQNAAHQLHDALMAIPSGREIWQNSSHPHFAAAMNALAAGNLQQGLTELSQESAFNTVFNSLNNLYVVSINQRAISIMRAGVTVRYEFDRNQDAFTEFIRGAQHGEFQPRILWMAMGLYYERLLVSGELTQYAVQQGTGGGPGGLRRVGGQRLTGTGDVFSVTPQLAIGASAWGNPMEIVLHCNVGYQQYELGTDVPVQGGGTQRVSVGDQGAYIGVWGVEVNLPGREGRRAPFRLGRFGVGAVGLPTNFYANLSFDTTWTEGNQMRLRSTITPEYSYFLQQHRVGGEIRPADFTFQVNRDWTLFFGPGFRYNYNITNDSHYLEGYGRFGFEFNRTVGVDLRGGYLGEIGGPEGQRVPSTPYGSLNITITPQFFTGRRRVTSRTVPRREGGE